MYTRQGERPGRPLCRTQRFADGFAESVGWGKAKDAQSEGGKKKRKKKAAAVAEEEEPMADWEKFVMQVRRAVKLMHCDRCRLEPR